MDDSFRPCSELPYISAKPYPEQERQPFAYCCCDRRPMLARIAYLALGTGDIEYIYPFALYEQIEAVKEIGAEDAMETLKVLTEGKRLKDISDLPLDLAI